MPRFFISLIVALVALTASPASAQPTASTLFPITVSADRHLSVDTGADLTFLATTGASQLEERALARLSDNPKLRIPVRVAAAIFVDHPVALFMVVFDHEAYGHGGRAREFGARASVNFGSPWKPSVLFEGNTRFGGGASWNRILPTDEMLRVYAGGVEANARSATIIERELAAGTALAPMQLVYLIRSRSYASYYVLSHTPDPARHADRFYTEWSAGGDIARYLGYLNEKYFGTSGITTRGSSSTVVKEYRRLRTHAWINALDPGMWLAGWSIVEQIATGQSRSPLHLPALKGNRVLPIVTADWMPDGGVVSLETVFGGGITHTSGPRWFSIIVRSGTGPGGRMWSLGGASEKIAAWKSIRWGSELELWNQPSYGTGAGAIARGIVTTGALRGFLIDVGFKTKGQWPGRPAKSGPILRGGYRFVLPQ